MTTYMHKNFRFVSTYMYHCMIDFFNLLFTYVTKSIILASVVIYVYNRLCLCGNLIFVTIFKYFLYPICVATCTLYV